MTPYSSRLNNWIPAQQVPDKTQRAFSLLNGANLLLLMKKTLNLLSARYRFVDMEIYNVDVMQMMKNPNKVQKGPGVPT